MKPGAVARSAKSAPHHAGATSGTAAPGLRAIGLKLKAAQAAAGVDHDGDVQMSTAEAEVLMGDVEMWSDDDNDDDHADDDAGPAPGCAQLRSLSACLA